MALNFGIIGFGVVGKSALGFFSQNNKAKSISVWDSRSLDEKEKELINSFNANFYEQKNLPIVDFLNNNDLILISPGIDLSKLIQNYSLADFQNKLICELDIFADFFKKPSIAITGTLGKTSITNLLKVLTSKYLKSEMCGNIGTGMLDIINKRDLIDLAVLELSSFQLELSKVYSPDIAIITNFYQNHLDRHKDLAEYLDAKCKIFQKQKEDQYLLINTDFLTEDLFLKDNNFLRDRFIDKLKNTKSKLCFISNDFEFDIKNLKSLGLNNFYIFHNKNNNFYLDNNFIFDLSMLPEISFMQNWQIVLACLYLKKFNLELLKGLVEKKNKEIFDFQETKEQEHRFELFATINGIDFYNDSKSTVIQSTMAALDKLNQKNKPIILILSGLSKGADRTPLVKYLSKINNLKKVICLGFSPEFKDFESYSSLKDLVFAIMQIAKQGDQILFSPSGSSFDFFKDYKQRGLLFKEAVINGYNYKKGSKD